MSLFKKIREKLDRGNSKEMINNLAVVAIVCVIILISLSVFFPNSDLNAGDNNSSTEGVSSENNIPSSAYSDSMEDRLKKILSKIEGVGEVEAMITYETSTEVVPASNVTKSQQTTKEQDREGGTRVVEQENTSENIVTVSGQSYDNAPIVIKEIKPVIRGVIVVAEGAEDPQVKSRLIDAVTTIFQIKSHRVKVYDKN
ncbi:MAG: stage III sporulation protein AG [Clostridia bacterium]|nr:stage III sporulation protein AG [Clostridia bacterium]